MTRIVLLLLPIAFVACSPYRSRFDCPIPKGIPCTSVTEIEAMIEEREEGPDRLNVPPSNSGSCDPASALKALVCRAKEVPSKKRVWIESYRSPAGYNVGAHYVEIEEGSR